MTIKSRRLKDLAKRFESDGCTFAPDFDFTDCCYCHDYMYEYGKDLTGKSVTREEADANLRACLINKGRPIAAQVYYYAVRIFGKSHWIKANNKPG